MSTIQDFTGYQPTWCPGCGNWGIGVSVKLALVQLGLSPSSTFVVFGIGCSGNMNDFLNAYSIHSLHGRSIPTAIGMKISNHEFTTLVIGGDGDIYGEGGNHFIHGMRGNHDITVIVHDNRVYGLTTGQVSPTADKGFKSKSTPQGTLNIPFKPLDIAISQGATFVGQAFAGDTVSMVKIIKSAISHKGFSLVNVLQPCVSFNKVNTYAYYKERLLNVPKVFTTKKEALSFVIKARSDDKLPVGVIFKKDLPTYTEMLTQLKNNTLVKSPKTTDIDSLLEEFI